MTEHCPVDRLTKRLAIRCTPQAEDLDEVLNAVAKQYLTVRGQLNPKEALERLGPELEDLTTVLAHAIDHMVMHFADVLGSRMTYLMEQRGLPMDQQLSALTADRLQQELEANLPGLDVRVHAIPMGDLHERLAQIMGDGGSELADSILADVVRDGLKKSKEVLH